MVRASSGPDVLLPCGLDLRDPPVSENVLNADWHGVLSVNLPGVRALALCALLREVPYPHCGNSRVRVGIAHQARVCALMCGWTRVCCLYVLRTCGREPSSNT